MNAKEQHEQKLLEYLSEPDNEPLGRLMLGEKVLGLSQGLQIYFHFTPDELCEIEKNALDIRRTKYSSQLCMVDKSLLKSASEGDTMAAKLCYQRFEGWGETKKVNTELSLKDMSDEDLSSLIKSLISENNADSV